MPAQTKLFITFSKLIEYFFSAVNVVSFSPCVIPSPRIKIIALLCKFVKELYAYSPNCQKKDIVFRKIPLISS